MSASSWTQRTFRERDFSKCFEMQVASPRTRASWESLLGSSWLLPPSATPSALWERGASACSNALNTQLLT